MPNKIYIEYKILTGNVTVGTASLSNKKTLEIPLTSDITVEATSEWSRLNDFIPDFLGKTLKLMNTVQSLGGGISEGFANLTNKLELPFWMSSPPVKINAQIGFFTKTDAYTDVVEPIKELLGLSILSRDPDDENRFLTPGINLKNFSQIGKKNESSIPAKSKLVSFEIPGVVYLPIAIIESARPTYSNEVTETSFPLWATLDLNIMGAVPANTDMFDEAIASSNRFIKESDYFVSKLANELK